MGMHTPKLMHSTKHLHAQAHTQAATLSRVLFLYVCVYVSVGLLELSAISGPYSCLETHTKSFSVPHFFSLFVRLLVYNIYSQ